jgi:hypothetical protein
MHDGHYAYELKLEDYHQKRMDMEDGVPLRHQETKLKAANGTWDLIGCASGVNVLRVLCSYLHPCRTGFRRLQAE